MEINFRNSRTENSIHVNIRNFLIKEIVDKKELEINDCPTPLIIADFSLTLVRQSFCIFRDKIMGYTNRVVD